ncbi:dephospho-CoA kinase [Coriobacterium glomerans PW2]|uniref:Dephospho-CoA kinase n=1 Tax=Coriobacterium glomerans (strain ATCC 49209 / DSM 20642 / JCM 10262 / PW2) TaxID=700015 RepID=F2NBJ5_CORGP|nr:dephospho-CoA kinase [Coriobacterium glomerans]AEB06731.1 dephospho-CoA kinase [Coriobacterium glomerans PW2]
MFKVFVIGNLASGKSTVVRHLRDLGASTIDLDEVAKDLYRPGSDIVAELAGAFGEAILDAQGALRTSELASRAFASAEQLERLNAIVHPIVRERLRELLETIDDQGSAAEDEAASRLVVVEVSVPSALGDIRAVADEVVAVTAPLEVRRARALRRGMDPRDFDRRCALQPSESELRAQASFVLDNSQDGRCLVRQLDAWLAVLSRAGER